MSKYDRPIGIMVRVFANGLEDQDSQVKSYLFFFFSWLDFANEDLWRRLSLSTVGMLMAD